MFEISELKAKKLPELQDIAQKLSVPKYRSLKKLDLVYQILDFQASNPDVVKKEVIKDTPKEEQKKPAAERKPAPERKPRERVQKKPEQNPSQQKMEFVIGY